MQLSPNRYSSDTPFFDQDEAGNSQPRSALTRGNSQTAQQYVEDEPQDDSDVAFDYDLLLPPPVPLPQKVPSIREPLQVIYEYPIWKVPKFIGKEQADKPQSLDRQEVLKNYNKLMNEKTREDKVNVEDGNEDTPEEPKRLCDFFADEEKIVFRRRYQEKDEIFNQTCYNLKVQQKRNVEDTEIGWETIDENNDGKSLRFESRFESGNLAIVSVVDENEYNMLLQCDINTFGYGQWFFFAVSNTQKNQTVKFNILNYRKMGSLHNQGMRIFAYSTTESKKSNVGWTKTTNAEYYRNYIKRENTKTNKSFRTLSFEYSFKHDSDCVFFAYGHPYTYSDLLDYLDSVETDSYKSKYFGRSTLCKTLAGNKCELVTITNRKTSDSEKKKCIFLASRVHPGEPNSSYVIQGVMDFLLSNTKEAESLREKFIFKIIPMMNPDGVIHGNSRCSLAGCDLNRKWQKPSPKLHPTIYYAKRLASELNRKYGVVLFCDFHGHSKRKDMFLYGCQVGNLPLETRVFAWVLSQISPLFSYRKSSFFIESSKLGAARVCLYQELKIKYSYTLETSFYGPEKAGRHFTMEDLIEFGGHFCKAILLQFSKECGSSKKQAVKDVDDECADLKRKMIEELYSNKELMTSGEPDSGSESEISDDDLPATQLKALLPRVKKRAVSLKKNAKSPIKPNKLLSNFAESKTPKPLSDKNLLIKDKGSQKVMEVKRSEKSPLPVQKVKSIQMFNSIPCETPEKGLFETQDFYNFTGKNDSQRSEGLPSQQELKPTQARNDRERESKASRVHKERKFQSIGDGDFKKSGNCAVVNLGELPSFWEKSLIGPGGLKYIRNMKEVKSGRELKVLGDNIWDSQPFKEEEVFREDVKEGDERGGLKDTRDAKLLGSLRDPQEETGMQSRSRAAKKSRGPYMLEPLGKGVIYGKFDAEYSRSPFKTNKAIRHPGFTRRVEEDFINKDTVLSRHMSGMFGSTQKWDNLGGLDRWKYNMKVGEEIIKNIVKDPSGMLSGIKGVNVLDKEGKEDFGDYMFTKEKVKKEENGFKKSETLDQLKADKKLKNIIKPLVVFTSLRPLDVRVSGSVANSPAKNELGSLKSLSTTQKAIPNKPW